MPLTEQQQQVIENPYENKLVCSLPGNGKTLTSVKLAEAITQKTDTSVLMVTFTNSAAQEMANRITKSLKPQQAQRVVVRTFAKIMIEQFKQFKDPRRLILGPEFTNYIHRVARSANLDFEEYPLLEQDIELIGRLSDEERPNQPYYHHYLQLQKNLKAFGRIDLQSLVVEVIEGLEEGVIEPLPFTHFLVDEYQDSDSWQLDWLIHHNREGRFFTVVGDDDQSIYSWRGAKGYSNMVKFQQEFNAKGYILGTCFRCCPSILGTAQRLIEHNTDRIPKNMKSGRREKGKVIIDIVPKDYCSTFTQKAYQSNPDYEDSIPVFLRKQNLEQYRYVVDSIEGKTEGLAMLARTNRQLDTMEFVLSERGIRSHRIGGRSLFDDPNVVGYAQFLMGFSSPRRKQALLDGLGWVGIQDDILYPIKAKRASTDPLFELAENSQLHLLQELSQFYNHCVNHKPSVGLVSKLC